MDIRVTNAYGPQEYDNDTKKFNFWNFLDNEIFQCNKQNVGCLIFMDGNAWLGSNYIKDDPHNQNKNGKMFANFLARNPNLNLMNSSNICKGLITRSRTVNSNKEESVIDFVLSCNMVFPFVKNMLIDEEKIFSLANYSKKQQSLVHSDHNSIIVNLNLKEQKVQIERKTIFNFRNSEGLNKFKMKTTNTNKFSKCFSKQTTFKKQCKEWSKLVTTTVFQCFAKIRINPSKRKRVCNVFRKRKKCIQSGSKKQQLNAEMLLKEENESLNFERIMKSIQILNQDKNKQKNVWKLKNKFFPKIKQPVPVAKINLEGQIITNTEALKKLHINHFVHRMRSRPIIPGFENHQKNIEDNFEDILKITKTNIFPDWNLNDLNKVLKSLKKNQSQDTMQFANEIFVYQNIGSDLKNSILLLCNKIKNNISIPSFMNSIFISAIPKKKKSPLNLENQRGIFLVPKIRSILVKLIYNSIIGVIEDNLTSSNIGARKGRAPRDHLFVLHSVVTETLRGKEGCDLVFYDVVQCFDSLWVEKTLTDLHTNGVTSNLLNVIHELCKTARVKVKTPVGTTEEKEIEDIVMQGETLSSILCTNSMDLMAKECKLEEFDYRENVKIPKIGFVDDVLDINKCGKETLEMNHYTRDEMNKRKLQLSYDKCARMHVKGKSENRTECETVVIDEWETKKERKGSETQLRDVHKGEVPIRNVDEYLYLGDLIRSDGSSKGNVKLRLNKGHGIIRDILHILEEIYLGPFFFEALKQLRDSMFVSVITYNLEVSSNLSKSDLKALDDLDLTLLRKALLLSSKSSKHLIYLETGILSIEFILKKKRIMYYHNLLSSDDSSLSKKVLMAQIRDPKRTDWFKLVKRDLEDLNIQINPDEIVKFSKDSLKKKVREACKNAFFNSLIAKKNKMSKGKEIKYKAFETQTYLKGENNVPKEIQQKIMHLRIRDVPIKMNFPGAFEDRKCSASELCNSEETQSHIFSCYFLTSPNQVIASDLKYENIFNNCVKTQESITQIFFQRFQRLKQIISSRNSSGDQ